MLKSLQKKTAIIFVVYLNSFSSNISFSQNYGVSGSIIFNPRTNNIIKSYSFEGADNEDIDITIDSKSYRFMGKIPTEISKKGILFKVKVVFNDSTIYVNDRTYQRQPQSSFIQKILLEKTSDLYKNYKDDIENSANAEEILYNFQKAYLYINEKNSNNKNSQILELYRTASNRLYIIGEDLKSIKYLEEGFNKVNFDKITVKKRINVYWKERVYRFLKINKYTTRDKYPGKVVARNLLNNKGMLDCWMKLTEQISKIYPNCVPFNNLPKIELITKDIEQLLLFVESNDNVK